MKVNSVAILGLGAVGSYVLWGLSEKPDIELSVIAKGDRKLRYEKEGFVINGKKYHPMIKTPEEASGVDLLVVATKYNSLKSALSDIEKIVDRNTIVMSLMNGVESEEIIAEKVGEEHIMYSLIKVAAERDGNSVVFDPETTIGIIYGEKDLNRGIERVEALAELFNKTKLHHSPSDVIIHEIWNKFRLNIANNQIQAIIGCGVGGYRDSEHLGFLRRKVREELEEIAKAKGIDFSLCKSTPAGSKVADRARYSTLQDIDAGRHTEIDMFAGTVVRMGKELNIPTPYNEFIFHVIKALEEKNDGKFDYDS